MKDKKCILGVIPKFAEEHYKKQHAKRVASKDSSDEHQKESSTAKDNTN